MSILKTGVNIKNMSQYKKTGVNIENRRNVNRGITGNICLKSSASNINAFPNNLMFPLKSFNKSVDQCFMHRCAFIHYNNFSFLQYIYHAGCCMHHIFSHNFMQIHIDTNIGYISTCNIIIFSGSNLVIVRSAHVCMAIISLPFS